jgi:ubiquinone/menaquinone biosynthesis C-methylase UbiE/uncharacterized protein YbaR (Trm112 family)
MQERYLEILRCPVSGGKLRLEVEERSGNRIKEGLLISENASQLKYRISNFIPRFVPQTNYADNFGFQWNKFSRTQYDSQTGHPITANRFWGATGWNADEMKGQFVLDVGCGSGRFAEVALQTGAVVVAIDYSNAVDAAYQNLQQYDNLVLLQADVYQLPFAREVFPYAYSLGVLQHTPDAKKSFDSIVKFVKPGGSICVDLYWKRFKTMIHTKYLFRPITTKMNKEKLFSIIERVTPTLLKISNFFFKIPAVGKVLSRLVPVANYNGIYPLSQKEQLEWSILDTFDWFSPSYDNPQTPSELRRWLTEQNIENIEIFHEGHLVARGTKKCG